jgi:hypothetical protein
MYNHLWGVLAERYVVQDKKERMKNVNMSICTSLTSFNSPRKILPASATVYTWKAWLVGAKALLRVLAHHQTPEGYSFLSVTF